MKRTNRQTRPGSIRRLLQALTLSGSLLALHSANAASGTWNVDSNGLWSAPANWNGSVPAAAGDTANLTYNLTAARVITNDVSEAVGILNIGNPGSAAFGYTLTNNSGITFTLNNNGAGAQINQTDGTLALDIIATPIVLADNLFITNNSFLKLAGVISGTGFGITKGGGGTLTNAAADTFTGPVTVNGGTLLFATGGSINNASSLTINSGGTVQFSGSANGNPIGSANLPVTVNAGGTLAITSGNAMGYSGQGNYANILLNGGSISLSAAQYINTLLLNGGSVTGTGALQWYYTPAAPAAAITCTNTATISSPINFNSVGQTIAVSNNATLTISGVIAAAGTGVTKAGQGTLTLAGVNSYTTPTTVNAGLLNIATGGSLSTGTVTVRTNATLAGTGSIGGATTIQAGGTLAIGTPTIGTLTMKSSLMLASGSTNVMKINKTGGSLIGDAIQVATSVTYGGTLMVANITTDGTPLANGDTVQLFSATTYAGGFSGFILPALPAGLSWDISQLAVTGFIAVSSSVSTPFFNPLAGYYPSAQTVTITSLTPGATVFYTTDGSTPTTSSAHGVTPVTVTVLAGIPTQTVMAFATLAGQTTSGTATAVYNLSWTFWSNLAGGNWSDTASWLYGFEANGPGITADFSTLVLPGDTTVLVDTPASVGGLVFADRGNAHNWILADGGAGGLTLDNAGATPVITVSNQTATIVAPLNGTAGLTKSGSGTLNLAGANTYTGLTTDNAGTLGITSFAFSSSSPLSIATGATVNSSGTLSLNAGSANPAIGVTGSGTLQLTATNNSASSPDIYLAANDVDGSTANWGTRIATRVNLGSVQRYIWGKSNHNGVGQYGVTSADCQFGGAISGAGGLTIIAQDSIATGSTPMEVGFCLNAANTFTGPVEIQRGSVYQGAAGAFPAGNVLRFNVAAGNKGKFFLYGQNTTVSDLSSTGAGSAYIANGNANPSAYGPVTLTITQNNPATYAGLIADVNAEYGVTAGTKVTTLSLVKSGVATLTLSGANTYSGTTTVSAGKLVLSPAQTGTGAITVNDGATLGVTVSGSSQLSPSALTEGSASGPTINEFTGVTSAATAPIKVGTLTLQGTTTINVVSGAFAPGINYPLIAFTNLSGTGTFVVGTLPPAVVATVVTNGSTIALHVTSGTILNWNGLVSGTWDIGSTPNWTLNGATGNSYSEGAPVVFDDTAAGTTMVSNTVTVSPGNFSVNNSLKPYTISGLPIAGSTPLTKTGTNSLTLNGANTFTGNIAIAAGTLTIGGAGVLGGGVYAGAITNNGTFIFASTADETNSGAISGSGSLVKNGTGTLTLSVNEPLTGGITVNSGTLRVTTDDFGGQFSPSLVTINTNGTLLNDNYHALGYETSLFINQGTWIMNYEDYKTNLIMIDGQVNAGPAGDGGELRLGYSGTSAITVSNSVVGSVINETVNDYSGINVLNVYRGAAASDLTINGVISSSSGGGLVKNGNGILTLTAANSYTGPTTVNAGTLALGAVSSLAGPLTLETGASLVVAGATAGTVMINNTLTLADGSTNVMKMDKSSGKLVSDSFQGLAGVTYGGTLVVNNITTGPNTLANGDTVQLFAVSGGTYDGAFSSFVLPALPAGLSWDASQLAVTGYLSVVSTVSPPLFNPPAGSYVGAQTVTIHSLTPGATIYYTTDGSAPTIGSTHGVTPVTVTVLDRSPSETLTAYAALPGRTSSATISATYTSSSSVWTNSAGGNWSDTGSWLYSVVGNGSGITADFSTLDLAHDTTVVNDNSPTVGNLLFADQGNAHNWLVTDLGSGIIELDNGGKPPVITVGNQTATIATVLDGTSGLIKAGNGTLALAGANTYTGTTTVGAGTLSFLNLVDTYRNSPLIIATGAIASFSATLNLDVSQNGSSPSVNVSGGGTLRLTSTNNSASSPDLYFGPDHVSNSYWGAHETAPLDLGSLQRYIYCKTGHNGVGEYTLNDTDVMFDGSISGSGGLTFIAQNTYTGSPLMEVGIALNASNSFTGPLEIQRGSVYLGNPYALSQTNVLFMNAAAGNNARFFLYGHSIAVANLSSSSTGANVIANGNKLSGATLTCPAVTLTVIQNTPGTFAGAIQDVLSEYDGSGSGTTGPLGLTKTGASKLTLAGANTYSGPTLVNAGTLQVNGVLAAGAVTVASGGMLAGTGTLAGATTVQSGGTLAPGNNGLGTLAISNTLTLGAGSTTTLAIDRTSGTGSYGNIAGFSSATFGGTLTVTSLGGTFQVGDNFQLFSVGGASHFTTTNLPSIAPLLWNWNPAAGTLSVVSAVSTAPAKITAVVAGGMLSLAWPADHTGWRLLVQTAHQATGVSSSPADWTMVTGSAATNQVSIAIDTAKPTEFYRLVYP